MTLPLVIVNPASAGGATGEEWPRLASELRAHFGAFACEFTRAAGDAMRIAERETRAGRKFVIACGGDGTISEVANGLLASDAEAELGIYPSGTGGDFRRTLGIPRRSAAAALSLRDGRAAQIDAVRVKYRNSAGETAERFFVNVASCGLGGEVVRRMAATERRTRRLPTFGADLLGGRMAYAAAAVRATLGFENPLVRLSLDGAAERSLVTTALCVANARYFGGGMKIAPEAKLADGRFDVIAVGALGAFGIFANAHRLYLGTHLGMREVRCARALRLTARPADESVEVLLEVDGEFVGTLPATFEVVPRALRVRVPA